MDNNLIFDLGFHIGEDTDFYLKKGFKVIAVEANPELYNLGLEKFSENIEKGQLVLLNRAISDDTGKIKFYIHPTNKDWSSCFKEFIRTDKEKLKEIEVDGISLKELYRNFKKPRYIKVDIEGADVIAAKQLFELEYKPKFVSFETSRRDYAKLFAYLLLSGYAKFQLINQLNYKDLTVKDINNEGNSIDYTFRFGSSGLFGEDLPSDKWINYDELLFRYLKYIELRSADHENLSLGWLDIHARLN